MRKELKYYMDEHKAFLLHKMLACFCKKDPHFNGDYTVKSLYFDRIDNQALHEKLEGIKTVGKIRLRTYNDSLQYKLEYKYKKGEYVSKQSIDITSEKVDEICKNPRIINDYFKELSTVVLKPKVIILYDRKVLTYPQGQIRFTFDYNMRRSTSYYVDLKKNQLDAAVFERPTVIFEVKYSHAIPEHLKRILMEFGVQASISKYAISRTGI